MNFEIISEISEENHVAITWIIIETNLGLIGECQPTKKAIKTK